MARPARSPRIRLALRILAALLVLFAGAPLQAATGRAPGCAHHAEPAGTPGNDHAGHGAAPAGPAEGPATEAPPPCTCLGSCLGGAPPPLLHAPYAPTPPPLPAPPAAPAGRVGRPSARSIPFLLPFGTAPPRA